MTFETTNSSYILVKTLKLDPFNQDILLSFRSHAPSGILLYVHDNLHNFIQLHLENGQQVVFTFNNADKIHQLVAVSGEEVSFSDGKWHQIHVKREQFNTTLTVDYQFTRSVELPDGSHPLTSYSRK